MKSLIMTLITFSTVAAHASFLSGLTGPLSIGGDKCKYEGYTFKNAYGEKKGTTLNIYFTEMMEGSFEIQTAIHFYEGNGSKKNTRVEGDILRLPVSYRTTWKTDEATRTSDVKAYEGVAIPVKVMHHTLKQIGENIYVWSDNNGLECYLGKQ